MNDRQQGCSALPEGEPDFENPGFREGLAVGFSHGWEAGKEWGEEESGFRRCGTCRRTEIETQVGVKTDSNRWWDDISRWEQEVGEDVAAVPRDAGAAGDEMPPVPEGWSARLRRLWEMSHRWAIAYYRDLGRAKYAELAAYHQMTEQAATTGPAGMVAEVMADPETLDNETGDADGDGAGWLEEQTDWENHQHKVVLPARRFQSDSQAHGFHNAVHNQWKQEHPKLAAQHRKHPGGGLAGEAQMGAQTPEGVSAAAVLCLKGDNRCGETHGLQLLKDQTGDPVIQASSREDIQPVAISAYQKRNGNKEQS